jgi:acetylornithine deacetylase/succinyl-diaminopimelate desuccinylase-like protein
MDPDAVRGAVNELMPEVVDDLAALVAHPSVAFPGFPAEPVLAMADATVTLFERAGMESVRLLDIPGGYPAVFGELPPPPGAPTVLLYAHYDVQPAAASQGWTSDPWTLTERAGRLYGRGAADDKSGILMHAAALRVFGGRRPVGVKLVVEGEEETASHLHEYVRARPELFRANAVVVADMGNLRTGDPVLTTALRGALAVTIGVRTLDRGLHSGEFGGAAPDAMTALLRILGSFVDDQGDCAVAGMRSYDWPGADYPEDELRRTAGMLDGVRAMGTGSVASRLWSKPTATVIGIDAPPVAEASNTLLPAARARVSLRIAPGADPAAEAAAVREHIRRHTPFGAHVEVHIAAAAPFETAGGGPAHAAARRALADAYGVPCDEVGSGGSIPLLADLAAAAPGAEFLLFGAEDLAGARIHGADESVDPVELERMIVAEVLTLRYLAENWR